MAVYSATLNETSTYHTGGPNVTISAHNPSSRWASAAQTVLSDPAPATGQVVSARIAKLISILYHLVSYTEEWPIYLGPFII